MPNQLAHETSPYLLQHRDNPVDWRPWGPEALALARRRDVPLLVSIGYSACHWCHVMERESFEDPAIAAVMNEHFVPIKVDREERPDVDAICMEAVQAMTGQGGWPLNAFLTPDQVPFHAGTYFPPEPRHGMPSWGQVLEAVTEAWESQREEIRQGAHRITPRLAGAAGVRPSEEPLAAETLEEAVRGLQGSYDPVNGGFAGAPKFPPASAIEFLLRRGEVEAPIGTLHAMARGGIHDQVGGGFARYAVDETWTVPHFEKMLYDNALLARAYLHGFQVTGDERLSEVCRLTLNWALREMRAPEGGFYSALDADSEGVEGRFYVWSIDELREVLGGRAQAAIDHFGASEGGNFEGVNILEARGPRPDDIDDIRAALLEVRVQRVWPGLDDKRLASWNALMISALAEAGGALDRPDYIVAARSCAEFVLDSMRDDDGRLLRTFNAGRAHLPAYLEDHAFLLEALLTLYEATFEPRWFLEARDLADVLIAHFGDEENGGFFSTADDHEPLIVRRKDVEDSPIPAGNSSAAFGLLRLAALTGEHDYEAWAGGAMQLFHKVAAQYPSAFGHLLQALDFHLSPTLEVAIVGEDTEALERTVREPFRPRIVMAGGPADGVPLLQGREPVQGRATAYVCERFACQAPVTDPEDLAALLD